MLASRQLPDRYAEWNQRYGAPFGCAVRGLWWKRHFKSCEALEQLRGPFATQANNSTREFEYPWAFEAGKLAQGMRVLEIGGGLSGFQFVLDAFGCEVVNVDPGMAAKGLGWPCDESSMERLNRRFHTRVELRNTTIANAGLAANSFDRAFSISVVEHLPEQEILSTMRHVYRCLKPGGLFAATVDLFLNLHPFCSRRSNNYGKNQSIRCLADSDNWELAAGSPTELFGFEEFKADAVQANLEQYLIGHFYPALVQCLVLRKPIQRI